MLQYNVIIGIHFHARDYNKMVFHQVYKVEKIEKKSDSMQSFFSAKVPMTAANADILCGYSYSPTIIMNFN